MERYAITEKITPKNTPPRDARSRTLYPEIATATIAATGSSTPAMRKPMIAGQKLVPELTPTIGGKIRLPAPKNIENSVNEAMMMVSSGEETFDFAVADATVSDIKVPVLWNCRCAKWSSKRGRIRTYLVRGILHSAP